MLNETELQIRVSDHVQRRIGQGMFISGSKKMGENKRVFSVGATCPRFIEDSKRHTRKVKFLKFNNLFNVTANVVGDDIRFVCPEREDIVDRLHQNINSLVFDVERSLLKASYMKLVKVPIILTTINPFREILNTIHKKDIVYRADIVEIRGTVKADRYLTTLEKLGYIRRKGKGFVEGNKFITVENLISDSVVSEDMTIKLVETMLGEIVNENFSYLTEYLNLTSLTPFLRWSNAYYFAALEWNSLITVDENEMYNNFLRVYEYIQRPKEIKFINQLDQIVKAGILHRDGDYVIGDNKIFTDIQKDISFSHQL